MKIIINKEEYELSEECIRDLLEIAGQVVINADFPREIKDPLLEMTDIDESNLIDLIAKLRINGINFYHGLATPVRLVAIQVARWIIARVEMRIDSKEAREILRPPRRKDPLEHLVDVFYPIVKMNIIPEIAKIRDGIIEITTEQNTATSIKFSQNRDGGTLALNGDIGEWEDNSGQNAG